MNYNRSQLRSISKIPVSGNEKHYGKSPVLKEVRQHYLIKYEDIYYKSQNFLIYKLQRLLKDHPSVGRIAIKDMIEYRFRIINYQVEYTNFKRSIGFYKV